MGCLTQFITMYTLKEVSLKLHMRKANIMFWGWFGNAPNISLEYTLIKVTETGMIL